MGESVVSHLRVEREVMASGSVRSVDSACCLQTIIDMPLAQPLNFPKWLAENSDRLQPPIGNFCLYDGQDHTVMVVGGPNARRDCQPALQPMPLVPPRVDLIETDQKVLTLPSCCPTLRKTT